MKIICISDTHNQHEKLLLPEGDCIIHAGDFTDSGTKRETKIFLEWFSSTPYKHKIFIAGNHDFYLQKKAHKLNQIIPDNIHYLQDSGVSIEQINFWGSPVTPGDASWAFSRNRGRIIAKHWEMIPHDTHVLITHSPPFGIMDELDDKTLIGCKNLSERLKELQISVHTFGHVHNDYGMVKTNGTTYINSSFVDGDNRPINGPITITHR